MTRDGRVTIPPGPWDDEPDKVQWVDPATNLDCLMVRASTGAWCGYVGVPQGHPSYGQDYDYISVTVHGGLTFANLCQPGEPIDGVCHVAEPGREQKPWWLGFDTAHLGDITPLELALERFYGERGYPVRGEYRDEAYVKAETTALAAQLAALSA